MLATSLAFGSRPMFFGWAKPVPIDPRWFRRPRLDWLLVAGGSRHEPHPGCRQRGGARLASPAAREPGAGHTFLSALVAQSVVINCVLAVFNLLRAAARRGGRVLSAILPVAAAQRLRRIEGVGLVVVLLVVFNTGILSTLVRAGAVALSGPGEPRGGPGRGVGRAWRAGR